MGRFFRNILIYFNKIPDRVGVVIDVDGRNIITGKRSNLKSTEAMYIVNAYETARNDS